MALGGVFADLFSLKIVYSFAGVMMFISILIFSFNPDMRKLLAYKPTAQLENNSVNDKTNKD